MVCIVLRRRQRKRNYEKSNLHYAVKCKEGIMTAENEPADLSGVLELQRMFLSKAIRELDAAVQSCSSCTSGSCNHAAEEITQA